MMKNTHHSKDTIVAISIVSTSLVVVSLFTKYQRRKENEIVKLQNLREAERRGRIKAEILLRSTIKSAEETRHAASSAFYASGSQKSAGTSSSSYNNNNNNNNNSSSEFKGRSSNEKKPSKFKPDLLLKCVGEVVSPFVKRMGTPRQGALAPHARGYIQINHSVAPMETLAEIDLYSHAWIIFSFHANTDCQSLSGKTKVRPPRAGGLKVGSMATRSPHRPNNIGLSLVKIVSVDMKQKRLYIAALDLVNGTPVYDIKPVVPWDIPGHFDGSSLAVPDWVSQEDAISEVAFSAEAETSLHDLVQKKILDPFYMWNKDGVNDAKLAIQEVLSQDPRAAKRRGRADDSKVIDPYKISFGSVQVKFNVTGDSKVNVVSICESNNDDCMYVDGIPLSGIK